MKTRQRTDRCLRQRIIGCRPRFVDHKTLSTTEKYRAMATIFFITQNSNNELKRRTCTHGSTQTVGKRRDKVSSPTASTEATMLTGMINTMEKQDVATCDIPDVFVQTDLDEQDTDGHRITIIKMRTSTK
jgi:hypothetical protein